LPAPEPDSYDLERFVAAQDAGGTYDHATAELRAGRKTSHWMWFVFPQIAGLGYSHVSRTYAITSLAEARAYLAHPVLGARLIECFTILAGGLPDGGLPAGGLPAGGLPDGGLPDGGLPDGGLPADGRGRTAEQIFGEVDALKLRSCATLFMHAAPDEPVFQQVLEQYYDGVPDAATEQRI
jgi:uncharacterized protein (DUF1810 family)